MQTGNFPITVTVTDSNGCTGTSATCNLVIECNVNPIVTTKADSGIGSLRYAVATACSAAGQNTVTFQPGPGRPEGEAEDRPDAPDVTSPISLTSGHLLITRDVIIQGPGADVLTIRNAAAASSTSRVFSLNAGVTASISGVAVSGGTVTTIGGGGIDNAGTLNLTSATVAGNTADGFGGAGGIRNVGTLNVMNSTISGNSTVGSGGGILSSGTFTIFNSTISGNTAGTGGGGR